MSYILDALKKSERERQQNQSPTVHSIHTASHPAIQKNRSKSIVRLLITLSLFVATVLIFWHFFQPPLPLSQFISGFSSDVNLAPATTVLPKAAEPVVANKKPAVVPEQVVIDESKNSGVTPNASNDQVASLAMTDDLDELPVMQMVELPDAVRNSLPVMTYSFHVYSTDQSRRTIIINNQRFREGQVVGNNWKLDSITETGIVLRQGRYRTVIDVVENW